jgi:Phage protein D
VIGDKKKTEVKASGDTQEIRTRIETKQQADKVAQAQKTLNDMNQATGRITTIGLPQVYASCQIELQGFGKMFDGLYYCSSITHEISRSGYTTEIEFTKNPKQGGKKKK